MKFYLIPFALLFFCISCREPKYINIKTTKLLILPPSGFHEEINFVGLKKDNNSAIEASDYDASYYQNIMNYSKEHLELKGGTVLSHESTNIDGYPAKLVNIKLDEVGRAWLIVFGDSSFFATLLGPYKMDDESTGEEIKSALLSVRYDKRIKTGKAIDNAVFKFDDHASIFKLAKSASNVFVYSVDGIDKANYGPDPWVIVHNLPSQGKAPRWLIDYMRECLMKEGYEDIVPDNESTEPINGYDAAECELHCSLNGQSAVMYHAAFVLDDKAVTVQGLCYSDFDTTIKEFKKLAHTIKFEE